MLQKTLRTRWVRLAVEMVAACALVPAFAQTPSPQTTGIDPALLAKANAGDAASQVLVGESYASGKGAPQDYTQAADWYRKAADKGDISGELHLAALYRDGGGKHFARDIVQAAGWYRKAADQGNVDAQATLGVLYSFGQGVPHSDVEAYFWLDLAASLPGPNQEKYVANRQMIGTHITQDELDAVEDRVVQWKAAHPRAAPTQ